MRLSDGGRGRRKDNNDLKQVNRTCCKSAVKVPRTQRHWRQLVCFV